MKISVLQITLILCLSNFAFAQEFPSELCSADSENSVGCVEPPIPELCGASNGESQFYALSSAGHLAMRGWYVESEPTKENSFNDLYYINENTDCTYNPAVLAITNTCHQFLEEHDTTYANNLLELSNFQEEITQCEESFSQLSAELYEETLSNQEAAKEIAKLRKQNRRLAKKLKLRS